MRKNQMRLYSQNLFSRVLLLICLILRMSQAWAVSSDYYALTLPEQLFHTRDSDKPSIIKIHSLLRADDGQAFHQEGVGWLTYLDRRGGVITPYHVVASAEMIVAEIQNKYFILQNSAEDREKDIAYLSVAPENVQEFFNLGTPLLFLLKRTSENKKLADVVLEGSSTNELAHAVRPLSHPPIETLENELFSLMLGMTSFGVVSSPDSSHPEKSLLLSPFEENIVQGNVERNLSYINNLIYIESLGVRPGLSGSVLFGTPYIDLLRTYDFSSNSSASALPVEILPKMILGMIVKTRLNGAETVALSLGDIFDFLEEKVANASGSGPASPRTLAVNYRMLGENDHRHLQSYYTLSGSSGPVNVQEYCADEYKNSADFNALKDPRLSKFLEQNKFQFNIPKEQNKADTDSGKKPTFDKFRKPAVPAQPDSQSLPPKNDSIKQNRSGGGEYGEGGDGFTLENTTFLTSETHIGNFKGLDLSFKGLGNSSSMGLYLQEKNCAARGLWVKDHLVHTVQVPGAEPQRMTNFEDLRRFHKTYGWRAADLLLQYGFASQTPFFEKDLKDNESLQIPLVTGEYISSQNKSWSPAGKKYFKQKIAALPATSAQKTSDVLSLRKNSFRLDTGLTLFAPIVDMFSANAPSVGHLQLDYQNHQWHGVFSYGDSCRVELTPDKFKQTNPYRVDYQDGKNEMSLDMFSEKQLLKISFQKLNCADLADLALGEIEIYGDAQLRPVIKTTRTAFVANPLNWSKLKQGYSTSKPGGEK